MLLQAFTQLQQLRLVFDVLLQFDVQLRSEALHFLVEAGIGLWLLPEEVSIHLGGLEVVVLHPIVFVEDVVKLVLVHVQLLKLQFGFGQFGGGRIHQLVQSREQLSQLLWYVFEVRRSTLNQLVQSIHKRVICCGRLLNQDLFRFLNIPLDFTAFPSEQLRLTLQLLHL